MSDFYVSNYPFFQLFPMYGRVHCTSCPTGLQPQMFSPSLIMPHSSLRNLQLQYSPLFAVPESKLHGSLDFFSLLNLWSHCLVCQFFHTQIVSNTFTNNLFLPPPKEGFTTPNLPPKGVDLPHQIQFSSSSLISFSPSLAQGSFSTVLFIFIRLA